MNNENILVKISADITQFSRSMKAATSDLDKFQKANKETFDAFKKTGKIVTAGGVAIAAGLGAAVKVASDFESAFAGVRKTVDATEEEFAVLKKGIRDMSKELPTSANEIAGVTEAAGQLGIKKEALLDFTRVMVDLGVATNMSAEEAANSLSRFANITNMSQSDFDRLGSTVVDLGNNFATTEGEIVEMGLRLAGAGAQVGMSESDILGLSAALSSVGIKAEMGGSAISKALVNMQVATSTGFGAMNDITDKTGLSLRELQLSASNTPKHFTKVAESLGMTKSELNNVMKSASNLENFAKISGMTGEEFKKAFETDAVGALGSFINGLGGAEAAGESAIVMLDEMGISEVRLRDSLLRAGNASELFSGAIDTANGAWDENVALTNEAEQRYKTFASRFEMFKNAIKDVGITIGDVLLPVLGDILDKVSGLISWFGGLNPVIITVATVFTTLIGALMLIVGPILLLIGFIPSIISGFAAIGTVISAVTAFFAPAAAGAAGVAGATSGLGAVMAAITGPIGIAIAAIVAVIAIFVLAYKNVEWFRDMVDNAWKKISEFTQKAFGVVKQFLIDVFNDIVSFGKAQLDKFKAFWDENGQAIMTLVKLYFNNIWEIIKGIMGVIKGIFETVWPIIAGIIKVAWNLIKTIVSTSIDLVLGIIQTVMKLLQGDWEGAWNTIKNTAIKIVSGIVKFFKDVDLLQIGKDILQGLIKGFTSMVDAVTDTVKNIAGNIKNAITDFFDIHSPSRVMAEIGKNIGEGLAIGVDATKAANEKAITGVAKVLSVVARNSAKEIEKIDEENEKNRVAIKSDFAKKREEIERKTAQSIQSALKTHTNKKGEIVTTGTQKVHKIQADAAAKLAKLNDDEQKKLVAANDKAWAAMQKKEAAIAKERLEAVKTYVADKKSLDELSLVAESEVWRKSLALFAVGTKERVEIQRGYQAALKAINDEITKTNEEYAGKMTVINDKLREEETKLTDAYTKTLDDRTNSLRNFAGIFDEIDMTVKKSGSELLANLQGQVSAFATWQTQIDLLATKAIDGGLLAELREMGPKALPELLALNSLTDTQLTQYSALYVEKSKLARQQAEKELVGMKADTQARITELRATANAELETLRDEWTAKIKSVTKATDDELKSLKDIGRNAGQGLLNGLASMEDSLVAKARSIANAVSAAMASALQVKSPSRVTMRIGEFVGEGLSVGMENSLNDIKRVAAQMGELAVPAIPQIAGYNVPRSGAGVGRSVSNADVSSGNGGGTTYTGPIHVTIDAKNVAEFNSVVEFMADLPQQMRKR